MKKANNIQIGSIVFIPYYEFAQHRKNYDGWLFTFAKVTKIGKNKKGNMVVMVEVLDESKKIIDGEYKTYTKTIAAAKCFCPQSSINTAQRIYDQHKENIDSIMNHKLHYCIKNNLIEL